LQEIKLHIGKEVTEGWAKLHNEELHNLYTSPNIIRVIKSRSMRLTEHVALTGEMRNTYNIFIREPGGKKPRGRPRC